MSLKALNFKANFEDQYDQKFPQPYLHEMAELNYELAQNTKPLYLSLIKKLLEDPNNKLNNELNIIDLGSSYGINTLLLRYNLDLMKLNRLFLEELSQSDYETLIRKLGEFLELLPSQNKLNFYCLDVSQAAIDFAKDAGLCEKGFSENLEENEASDELRKTALQTDLFISTGCIGYIGEKTFKNIFNSFQEAPDSAPQTSFAFSCLRIFDLQKIKEIFSEQNYVIYKLAGKPLRQRRFKNLQEREKTLIKLSQKKLPQIYEEDGYYYADFYVAGPMEKKELLLEWLVSIEENHH